MFLNTYFPPNQPRPKRCYEFGQAMRKAVESFPGDARVGVLASGGLSHFLVDEELDRAILKACADKDADIPPDPAAQQAARRQLGNPQLGGGRRRARASRPQLVRICAGLSHAGRHRHGLELRDLGIVAHASFPVVVPGLTRASMLPRRPMDGRVKPTAVRFDFDGRGAWHGFFWVSSVWPRSRHGKETTPCYIRILYFTVS